MDENPYESPQAIPEPSPSNAPDTLPSAIPFYVAVIMLGMLMIVVRAITLVDGILGLAILLVLIGMAMASDPKSPAVFRRPLPAYGNWMFYAILRYSRPCHCMVTPDVLK